MGIWEGSGKKYIIIAAVITGVYLSLKYLSPILSPFLLAFLIAGFLNRLMKKIPIKMKKSILAGVILLLIGTALLLLFWIIGCWLFQKCTELTGQMPYYEKEFSVILEKCCDGLAYRLGIDADAVEHYVSEQINVLMGNLQVKMLPAMMDKSMGCMKSLAGLAAFLIVTVIAVFLMIRDYEKLTLFLWRNNDFQGVREVGGKVIIYIKSFLKAQVIILGIISTVCAATLGLTGVKNGIFYGILAGLLDMLPFIGTGIILVPLAIFQLLSGCYGRSILILGLYGVCALLREFLEPKLIGDKVGIWPVGILLGVFAGVQLFGIFGIVKGPLGLVIIYETCRYLFPGQGETA